MPGVTPLHHGRRYRYPPSCTSIQALPRVCAAGASGHAWFWRGTGSGSGVPVERVWFGEGMVVWCRCVALRVSPLPSGLLYRTTIIFDTRRREWLHSTLPRRCASISAGNRAAGVNAVRGQRVSCFGRFGPAAHVSTRFLVRRSVIVVILF